MPYINVYTSLEHYIYQFKINKKDFNFKSLYNKLPQNYRIIKCYNFLNNEILDCEEMLKLLNFENYKYSKDYYIFEDSESDSEEEKSDSEDEDLIIDEKIIKKTRKYYNIKIFLEEKIVKSQIVFKMNKSLFLDEIKYEYNDTNFKKFYDDENIYQKYIYHFGDFNDKFKPIGRWWSLYFDFNIFRVTEFNMNSELHGKCFSYLPGQNCIRSIETYQNNLLTKKKTYVVCGFRGRKGLNIEKYGECLTYCLYDDTFYFYPIPDLKQIRYNKPLLN